MSTVCSQRIFCRLSCYKIAANEGPLCFLFQNVGGGGGLLSDCWSTPGASRHPRQRGIRLLRLRVKPFASGGYVASSREPFAGGGYGCCAFARNPSPAGDMLHLRVNPSPARKCGDDFSRDYEVVFFLLVCGKNIITSELRGFILVRQSR